MNNAVSREYLAEVFDHVVRDITRREAGIELQSSDSQPKGETCTVYTAFNKGYHTSLSLCAESSMFVRLTQRMMGREEVTAEDVEIFAKEFFNVLCGHIATQLYQTTRVPARFDPPLFYNGRYAPENNMEHIVLTYSSDKNEIAQLIHHISSVNHAE